MTPLDYFRDALVFLLGGGVVVVALSLIYGISEARRHAQIRRWIKKGR